MPATTPARVCNSTVGSAPHSIPTRYLIADNLTGQPRHLINHNNENTVEPGNAARNARCIRNPKGVLTRQLGRTRKG